MLSSIKKGERILYPNCKLAYSFFSRFMGLMGKTHLSEEEAIVFPRCSSIHTFFMRIPIDVLFVAESGEVIRRLESVKPWKLVLPVKGAVHTVEVAARSTSKNEIHVGDKLSCLGVFG